MRNGIDFILKQSSLKAPPPALKSTPPGGGKLTYDQRLAVLSLYASGVSRAEIARQFAVSFQAIDYLIKKALRHPSEPTSGDHHERSHR